MTASKLIGKLLKFKGFRCVDLAFRRDGRLDVLVKPFKNGCRCPKMRALRQDHPDTIRAAVPARYPGRPLVGLADVLTA